MRIAVKNKNKRTADDGMKKERGRRRKAKRMSAGEKKYNIKI